MYTLPVYEIKAIGNVKGAMFAPNSDTDSIPNDGNPLVANEHKSVRVSKIASARMRQVKLKVRKSQKANYLPYFNIFQKKNEQDNSAIIALGQNQQRFLSL